MTGKSEGGVSIHKQPLKLIVGLGNPGKSYANNRHNIGFRCINYLAKLNSINIKQQRQCQSQIGIGEIAGVESLLVKPKTFVNKSGEAVSRLMDRYKIPINGLLVIYDDLDLPPGKIRIRQNGSAGGHNGMKSIISSMGNRDFCRIKVGIGRPTAVDGTRITDEDIIIEHVLGNFTPKEDKIIKQTISTVAEAIECIITEGITEAMNRFN